MSMRAVWSMWPRWSLCTAHADPVVLLGMHHPPPEGISDRSKGATSHIAWCHHLELVSWHTHPSNGMHSVFVFQAISYVLSNEEIKDSLFTEDHAKQLIVD